MRKIKTSIFELTDEETDAIVKSAATSAVARTHAAGRYSTNGDEKGIYRLYPDGRKEYIEPVRVSVREALHTVAMECGPFTTAELTEFEKIAAGTKTTEQYRAEILAELEQETIKKRRK